MSKLVPKDPISTAPVYTNSSLARLNTHKMELAKQLEALNIDNPKQPSATAGNASTSYFLDMLPLELRLMIYELVYADEKVYKIDATGTWFGKQYGKRASYNYHGLLLACKQSREESRPLFARTAIIEYQPQFWNLIPLNLPFQCKMLEADLIQSLRVNLTDIKHYAPSFMSMLRSKFPNLQKVRFGQARCLRTGTIRDWAGLMVLWLITGDETEVTRPMLKRIIDIITPKSAHAILDQAYAFLEDRKHQRLLLDSLAMPKLEVEFAVVLRPYDHPDEYEAVSVCSHCATFLRERSLTNSLTQTVLLTPEMLCKGFSLSPGWSDGAVFRSFSQDTAREIEGQMVATVLHSWDSGWRQWMVENVLRSTTAP